LSETNVNEIEREPIKRAFNIRWIAAGAIVLWGLVSIGELLIAGYVIAPNEKLTEALKRTGEIQKRKDLANPDDEQAMESLDAEKDEVRSIFLDNMGVVLSLVVLLFFIPFAVGVAVGRFSGCVKDGALACAAGMVIVAVTRGMMIIALVALVLYLGIGALGGLVGRRLRSSPSSDTVNH
jgi:hypothetical protein